MIGAHPMTSGPDTPRLHGNAASTAITAIAAITAGPTQGRWHVRLLGAFVVLGPQRAELRLPSRACVALLARLALQPERDHGREELLELLWPGVDITNGRNRLRQTLSTLKSLLEPPGSAAVVLADRRSLRAAPGALSSDAQQFELLLRAGQWAAAAELYRGELLPGFFDEWITDERLRLAALADRLPLLPTLPVLPVLPVLPTASPPAAAWPRAAARDPPTPHQAVHPSTAPGWSRHAVPAYLTRYFGDHAQAARLRRQVLSQRLVTLVGPGGIGKTRLAVELAQSLRDTPDLASEDNSHPPFERIGFVALAPCRNLPEMQDALAQAFGLSCSADQVARELARTLTGQRTLLVLDNLEQLLPDAAPWLALLTQTLPTLHLLSTSRRVLGLDGEREVVLPALPLPAADAEAEALAVNPAVSLFIDRARAVRADFHLGARNRASVATLVRLLGGAPLALELAAARVRSLSAADMVKRLQAASLSGGVGAVGSVGSGLDLLARPGPRSGTDARHASMTEVIAWSWQLLPPALQSTLAAVTVFVGGFTAEAAAAVVGHDVALQLDEAVQHSLLGTELAPDGAVRLRFTEPVREFALTRLPRDEAAALRRRHRAWWPRWMQSLDATVPLDTFRAEVPNLVAALASALADAEPAYAVNLALAMRTGLRHVPLPSQGLDHLQAALELSADAAVRSEGLSLLAALEFEAGLSERAEAHARQALALAAAGSVQRARALQVAARIAWVAHRNRETARTMLDEALPLAERLGDAWLLAAVLVQRAYCLHLTLGQPEVAEQLFARQAQLLQTLPNRHDWHAARYHRINLDFQLDRFEATIVGARRLLTDARAEHHWALLSKTANMLGGALDAVRDWQGALPHYLEAAEVAWAESDHYHWAFALWNVPSALVRCGRPEDAACLMAFAAHYWVSRYGPLSAEDQRALDRLMRLARVQIGAVRWAELCDEGLHLGPIQAMRRLRTAVAQAGASAKLPHRA